MSCRSSSSSSSSSSPVSSSVSSSVSTLVVLVVEFTCRGVQEGGKCLSLQDLCLLDLTRSNRGWGF